MLTPPAQQLAPVIISTMLPNCEPTPQEQQLVRAILIKAGVSDEPGIITKADAMDIFAGANLSEEILNTIWRLAGSQHNNYLPQRGLGVAVRLMGWAQSGKAVEEELVARGMWLGPEPRCLLVTYSSVQAGPVAVIKGVYNLRILVENPRHFISRTPSPSSSRALPRRPPKPDLSRHQASASISLPVDQKISRSVITQNWYVI